MNTPYPTHCHRCGAQKHYQNDMTEVLPGRRICARCEGLLNVILRDKETTYEIAREFAK